MNNIQTDCAAKSAAETKNEILEALHREKELQQAGLRTQQLLAAIAPGYTATSIFQFTEMNHSGEEIEMRIVVPATGGGPILVSALLEADKIWHCALEILGDHGGSYRFGCGEWALGGNGEVACVVSVPMEFCEAAMRGAISIVSDKASPEEFNNEMVESAEEFTEETDG